MFFSSDSHPLIEPCLSLDTSSIRSRSLSPVKSLSKSVPTYNSSVEVNEGVSLPGWQGARPKSKIKNVPNSSSMNTTHTTTSSQSTQAKINCNKSSNLTNINGDSKTCAHINTETMTVSSTNNSNNSPWSYDIDKKSRQLDIHLSNTTRLDSQLPTEEAPISSPTVQNQRLSATADSDGSESLQMDGQRWAEPVPQLPIKLSEEPGSSSCHALELETVTHLVADCSPTAPSCPSLRR